MPEEKLNNVSTINFGEEFDTNGEFSLIDEGRYEVLIDKVEPRESQKGNKYLNVVFKIRSDVDQEFKNRRLFYRINSKEGDPTGYDFNRLNKLIITQKNTANYKKYFTDTDEVLQYLIGLHLVVTVEINFDDYSQKERNSVKDWAFEPSVWDMQDHPVVEEANKKPVDKPVAKNTEKIEIPEDELPWL